MLKKIIRKLGEKKNPKLKRFTQNPKAELKRLWLGLIVKVNK